MRGPGQYNVSFLLDSPRVVHCFPVKVDPDPSIEASGDSMVVIQHLLKERVVKTGSALNLQFRLIDPKTIKPISGAKDVHTLVFLAPGVWQNRQIATERTSGVYSIDLIPPRPGTYYVYIASDSLGLKMSNPQYLVFEARDSVAGSQ